MKLGYSTYVESTRTKLYIGHIGQDELALFMPLKGACSHDEVRMYTDCMDFFSPRPGLKPRKAILDWVLSVRQ